MSQAQPSFTERIRRALAPKAQDELDQIVAVQEHAEHERDRAEEIFDRLRGPGASKRPAWEGMAGITTEERQP